jgi:hypothetical protein
MWGAQTTRFDAVQVENSPNQWTMLKPSDFLKLPLVERIQLIAERRLRFFSAGIEISPVDALKD